MIEHLMGNFDAEKKQFTFLAAIRIYENLSSCVMVVRF